PQQLLPNQPLLGPMAQPNQQNFQELTDTLTQLIAALPNTTNALTNNTNAINNPPRREARVIDLPYFY
ncbi:6882_t:CDS:1, partial [Paraglomus occultum]